MNRRRTYVVAYDIRAPVRLHRVHRALTRLGHPLQYSVFAADLMPDEKEAALAMLSRLIDPRRDDVRVFAVPSRPFGAWYGACLARTVLLPLEPAATLAERLRARPFGAV
jgi:CRISPR-associated protein Cas2